MVVELGDVLYPVAVVGVAVRRTGTLVVLGDWTNPDYGERWGHTILACKRWEDA